MAGIEDQRELEAPAKVYQFQQLNDKIDRLEGTVNKMVEKLDTQVTLKYFEDRLLTMSTSFIEKMNSEFKERDNRMDGFQGVVKKNNSNISRFTWIVIGAAVTIVFSAVVVIYFTSTRT